MQDIFDTKQPGGGSFVGENAASGILDANAGVSEPSAHTPYATGVETNSSYTDISLYDSSVPPESQDGLQVPEKTATVEAPEKDPAVKVPERAAAVEVQANSDVLALSEIYQFDGKSYSSLDFSPLRNLKASALTEAQRYVDRKGDVCVVPEVNYGFCYYLAAKATGIDVDFFTHFLNISDGVAVRAKVQSFLFKSE